MNIPKPVAGGEIPEVEDGLYVARFDGITQRVVEAFKTDHDKFGKPDDGVRFDLLFTLLDEAREPVLRDPEDPDSGELQLRNHKAIKVFSSDDRSNSFAYMKGILTPAEFTLWTAGELSEEAGAAVDGRHINVQVVHSNKGWPEIGATLGPAKAPKGK